MSYKIFIGTNSLYVRFNKTDGFVRAYERTAYLVLFGLEKRDAICNRIGYLKVKKVVSCMFFLIIMQEPKLIHIFLPLEKNISFA